MRVRKRKNGDRRKEECAAQILPIDKENPTLLNLEEIAKGYAKFSIEIGCGKGAFVTTLAKRNPDIFYFAIEKVGDVIIIGAETAKRENIPNVRFLNCDAELIPTLFPAGLFSRIYLNFSDPWPKARHAKRRLTFHKNLTMFAPMLTENGRIEMKTDNRALFDFTLEEMKIADYTVENVTYDLHHSTWAENNIMTEYEKNFSEKGFPIHRLEAFPTKK